jgi:hypothetical protein
VQEAAKCMCARQLAALQRLTDACHQGNHHEYSKALQDAYSLGVESVQVAKERQAWDSRCSAVTQELNAAVHAKHFMATDFSSCQNKVQIL